jgi:hypothetical protein
MLAFGTSTAAGALFPPVNQSVDVVEETAGFDSRVFRRDTWGTERKFTFAAGGDVLCLLPNLLSNIPSVTATYD